MSVEEFLAEWRNERPTVLVHTSGSTGNPKPMWVEKRRMEASARMTCDFLGLREGDTALLCLPVDYIAGKMMVVRALVRRLRLVCVEPSGEPLGTGAGGEVLGTGAGGDALSGLFRPLLTSPDSGEELAIDFAAMVPMQVWNSLQVKEQRERLMAIRNLIIGGGAIDDALSRTLIGFPNQVWSTYGMTETLSHIALRRLNGPKASEWYTPFEGVTLSQTAEGCLVIDAPAVHDGQLITNDIAELADDGRFKILGRKDNVICSGGLKIQAEDVERLLRAHLSEPYLITKRRDEKFGEVVVLLTEGDTAAAKTVCEQVLPKFWQPRAYVHTDRIPLTATGKPARRQAEHIARK